MTISHIPLAAAALALSACGPAAQPAPRTAAQPPAKAVAPGAPPPAQGQDRATRPAVRPALPFEAEPEAPKIVKEVWHHLPGSKSACKDYDYFPEGGMRNFYCHLKARVDHSKIQELAGLSAFVKGPHTRERLDLNSSTSFGHYNKAFVRWLREKLVPGGRASSFREQTQSIYNRYVRPLARIFYVTYRKLSSNPAYLEQESARYLKLIAANALPAGHYEKYFYFMNPNYYKKPDGGFSYFTGRGFDGGVNGNVVKTCVAFWIRRSIDGTDREWFAGLQKLLRAYDPDLLKQGG
jgi:hypothetical protein